MADTETAEMDALKSTDRVACPPRQGCASCASWDAVTAQGAVEGQLRPYSDEELRHSNDDLYADGLHRPGHAEAPHEGLRKAELCGVDGGTAEGLKSAFVSDLHLEEFDLEGGMKPPPKMERSWLSGCCRYAVIVAAVIILLSATIAAAVFLGPFIFSKVIVPLMEWEEKRLSRPLLALVAVACMALLPLVMLPTGPSMWLLGITFDYFTAFCLIMTGAFFGQSLPYAVGHWLMHDRVQAWLSGHSRGAAILRLADSGGWWAQFKTTLFLRMSPFPYILFNYAITATKIQYGPYICASMVAMVPETFFAIYCGRLIQKLVIAHSRNGLLGARRITPLEIAYEVAGLCVAGSVVLVGMCYGRQALRELERQQQQQEELAVELAPHELAASCEGSAVATSEDLEKQQGSRLAGVAEGEVADISTGKADAVMVEARPDAESGRQGTAGSEGGGRLGGGRVEAFVRYFSQYQKLESSPSAVGQNPLETAAAAVEISDSLSCQVVSAPTEQGGAALEILGSGQESPVVGKASALQEPIGSPVLSPFRSPELAARNFLSRYQRLGGAGSPRMGERRGAKPHEAALCAANLPPLDDFSRTKH